MDWRTRLLLTETMTTKKTRQKKFWKLLKQDTRIKPDPAEHLESFVEGLHSEEDYWIKGYNRWKAKKSN
jgi:hypothetical protein